MLLYSSHTYKHMYVCDYIPTVQDMPWWLCHYHFCTSCCLTANHSCTANQKELCKNLNKLENSSGASISQIEIGSTPFALNISTRFLCNAQKYASTHSCHCWRHLALLVLLHWAAIHLALCRLIWLSSQLLAASMDTFVMSILRLYAPEMST